MAKKKKTVVSLKENLHEQIQTLKAKVLEMKGASENPKTDTALRDTRKKLKRAQRRLARMMAMEKRAEARAPKPKEPAGEEAAGTAETKAEGAPESAESQEAS